MELLIGLIVGFVTSGLVALFFYRRQKNDSTVSEQRLAFILEQALREGREVSHGLHSTMALVSGQQREMQQTVEDIRSSFVKALRSFADDLSRPALNHPMNSSLKLTVQELMGLHRKLMPETVRNAGQFRSGDILIEGVAYEPPRADLVPKLLSEALDEWNAHADALPGASRKEQVHYIAKLHHRLLQIHPFYDGNGALARTLLSMTLTRLLGVGPYTIFRDRSRYYEALMAADNDNLKPLEALIAEIADH